MKLIYHIAKCFSVLFFGVSIPTLAQWEMVHPKSISHSISDISFINGQEGWYCTNNGFIFGTSDTGKTWDIKNSISPDRFLSISFMDSSFGFAYSQYTYLHDPVGLVFTSDGGKSWENSHWLGGSSLLINTPQKASLQFVKPNLALATFENGNIYCSKDTFKTWRIVWSNKFYFLSDYGIPYGVINQFYKLHNGKVIALGNSEDAYVNNIIKDSVAYILLSNADGDKWDTLWCGLKHSIYDIAFLNDSIGWMCGQEKTILKTTNSGYSWNYVMEPSESNDNFISVQCLDSNTIRIIDIWGKVYISFNGGKDLQSYGDVPTTEKSVIVFTSNDIGFVGNEFGLFRTANGGETWEKQTGDYYYGQLKAMDFVDSKIGYSIVNNLLYQTHDGGYSWQQKMKENTPVFVSDIEVIDSLNIWMTNRDSLFHSIDGGFSWYGIDFDTLNINKIYFYDSLFGVIYDVTVEGNDYTSVCNIITTDGGKTWNKYQFPESINDMNKMLFLNKDDGWFDSQYGVYRSINGGKSWYNIMPHVPWFWNRGSYSFYFINQNTGWAAYYNILYKTTDGGLSWDTLNLPSRYETYDIYFVDVNNGFCVGFNGDLMSSTDGGESWTRNFSLSSDPYRTICAVNEKNKITIFIGGDGFVILKNDFITSINNTSENSLIYFFGLSQNYPNPFNPSTKIEFDLPNASKVTLKMYDVIGREVATLVNEHLNVGRHSTQFNASHLASGVYFYRITAGNFVKTKKMILLK